MSRVKSQAKICLTDGAANRSDLMLITFISFMHRLAATRWIGSLFYSIARKAWKRSLISVCFPLPAGSNSFEDCVSTGRMSAMFSSVVLHFMQFFFVKVKNYKVYSWHVLGYVSLLYHILWYYNWFWKIVIWDIILY